MKIDYLKIVECHRDSIQGIKEFIPTRSKLQYLKSLIKVGFDIIDIGSLVSPKVIPQMRDTSEILNCLELETIQSKLLVIIGNRKGARNGCGYDTIDYLGYPFSISPTFQYRNLRKTIAESISDIKYIHNLCSDNSKELVVYISMAFGNPYGDDYTIDKLCYWIEEIYTIGITNISLADTVGNGSVDEISHIFSESQSKFSNISLGVHLHSNPDNASEKIDRILERGCRYIDCSIGGMGGCPTATDELVSNIPTEMVLDVANRYDLTTSINRSQFNRCLDSQSILFE